MIQLLTADLVNVDQIVQMAPPKHAAAGRSDYEQGRVTIVNVSNQSAQIDVADLGGKRTYRVSAWLHGRALSLGCTCRDAYLWVPCRHRVAAALALHDYLLQNPPKIWKTVLEQGARAPSRRQTIHQGAVVFSLQEHGAVWTIVPYTIAARNLDPATLEDYEAIAQQIEAQELSTEAKQLRARITKISYPNVSEATIAAANLVLGNPYAGYGYVSARDAAFYEAVLPFLSRCLVYTGDEGYPLERRIQVLSEPGEVITRLNQYEQGVQLLAEVQVGDRIFPLKRRHYIELVPDPLWLLIDDVVVRLKNSDGMTTALLEYPELQIPTADQDEFFDKHLLPLSEQLVVKGDALVWDEVQVPPAPRLYLSEPEGQLQAELRFQYASHEVVFEKQLPEQSIRRVPGEARFVRIKRDPEAEQLAWQSLSNFGLKRTTEPAIFQLRANVSAIDFLLHQVPKLAVHGYTIFGEEALTSTRVNRYKPSISFNVTSGIDWFDVQTGVNFGELSVSLKELRQAVRKRERYIKLADGSIGELPDEWLQRYRHLLALGDETEEGDLRFSSSQITMLDQLLAEADRAQVDDAFQQRREKLRSFDGITPRELPAGFVGELRPYQKFGYDWLHFLREYGFGGCLADDMGVGKTVQTLAFLESLYDHEPEAPASLIVMPRSLLFNWQREAARFTPGLDVYVQADQGRITDAAEFGGHDLVLTTYGTLLRDIALLRGYTFNCIILDESQAIKNPLAETSKAARLLQGRHRLALTGTPVENTTMELWSQFAFLNPGLLGNLDYFRQEFVTPIERDQQQEMSEFLRKMVYPFILRRTKDQVAADLPPRSEELLISEMEPAQQKLYIKQRDFYRAKLLGLMEDGGMDDARMQILEGLLRLRQISNHPRLIDPKFKGSSGKFNLLLETLDTLRTEGHRALVFSQFVQMLSLVREALDERGIPYAYLDGQTRNREEVVDRFQNSDELPFFLISLKAGGVGLNLTAADYVIHVDPWWNPAVEQQATDRTHRIGQDKPVFVYKMIARDTVEEKILQLQERKRALVEQIIGAEGGVFKSLTREDVEVLFS